jgi:hypothetical protein
MTMNHSIEGEGTDRQLRLLRSVLAHICLDSRPSLMLSLLREAGLSASGAPAGETARGSRDGLGYASNAGRRRFGAVPAAGLAGSPNERHRSGSEHDHHEPPNRGRGDGSTAVIATIGSSPQLPGQQHDTQQRRQQQQQQQQPRATPGSLPPLHSGNSTDFRTRQSSDDEMGARYRTRYEAGLAERAIEVSNAYADGLKDGYALCIGHASRIPQGRAAGAEEARAVYAASMAGSGGRRPAGYPREITPGQALNPLQNIHAVSATPTTAPDDVAPTASGHSATPAPAHAPSQRALAPVPSSDVVASPTPAIGVWASAAAWLPPVPSHGSQPTGNNRAAAETMPTHVSRILVFRNLVSALGHN